MCFENNCTSKSESQQENYRRMIGFDAKNKDSLSTYLCHICNLIFRYPCQLNCGHRFCRSCLEFERGPVIQCKKCGEETERDKIMSDKGCEKDMENLVIICSLCEWRGIFKNYQGHLDEFHYHSVCRYCNQEFHSADSFTQHISICENTPISCKLQPYGCSEQFLRVNEEDHYLSAQHQNTLVKMLTQNNQEKTSSHTTMSMSRTNDDMSDTNSLEELYKSTEQLLGGVQALSDDTQRLNLESIQQQNALESLSEDISKVKGSVQETNTFLNAHKVNQQMFEQTLTSLQQQIDDLKNTFYDGTLTWKITDVQQKIADAQSEKQTSIYSPVFYSSPTGYRMRVRLYMAGDGNARRTHMSLFFVLMRGEYDQILEFPFSYKVLFCLLDQTPQQRHIIDSFRPDTKSNSFQRPSSDMNVASGIPKFVPLTMIQQDNNSYVRNDTMLIKVIVDFGNLPKTVLPYTMALNPGLPILIQRDYIKKEIEKRTQENLTNSC